MLAPVLCCRGCGRDGGRDAVKDEERRRQKPTAHAKETGQNPRQATKQHDVKAVHGQIRDGQIDIHNAPRLAQQR